MLRVKEVSKRYRSGNRRVRALDNVSLSLSPGERLGLVGPSGSGKSTLAKIMALLVPSDTGNVDLDGAPVKGWGLRAPRAIRRQIQLVWQSPRLATDPRLRFRELILEPLVANGMLPSSKTERKAILYLWANKVGLTEELLERYPHEVSDGQLQRACLARALVLCPRYLICDELSSMLDVSTQAALLQAVAVQQTERDLGVLLITHDRVLARYWCHTTVELEDGRIITGTGANPRLLKGVD